MDIRARTAITQRLLQPFDAFYDRLDKAASLPPLITREEARYWLAKENVLPRELLTDEEANNPNWMQFSDVIVKSARRQLNRYGPPVIINRQGEVVPRPIINRSLSDYSRRVA